MIEPELKTEDKRENLNPQDHLDILDVLSRFQSGYTERDLSKVDSFVDDLFICREDKYILGTGTEEFCPETKGVRDLVSGDWQWWGDVDFKWKDANICIKGNVAWVTTCGSVKYIFEESDERNKRLLGHIENKVNEPDVSSMERISDINWFLSLSYHQRETKKREYLWPLYLSGILLKENNKWKFVQQHFSGLYNTMVYSSLIYVSVRVL